MLMHLDADDVGGFMILAVMASSSREGETSSLGWLCARIIAVALTRIAGLSTSRG